MKRIKKWECKYINALVSTCFSLSGSNCHVQFVHALFTMLFCKKKTIFGNFQLNDGNICWQAIVCPTRSVMNFKWTKSLVFSWKMAKFKNNFILNLELPMSLASETARMITIIYGKLLERQNIQFEKNRKTKWIAIKIVKIKTMIFQFRKTK